MGSMVVSGQETKVGHKPVSGESTHGKSTVLMSLGLSMKLNVLSLGPGMKKFKDPLNYTYPQQDPCKPGKQHVLEHHPQP